MDKESSSFNICGIYHKNTIKVLVTSNGHRIATESSSKYVKKFKNPQKIPLHKKRTLTPRFLDSLLLCIFFWVEGIHRLDEWWTWIKGPWHGRRAERHNLLQLCGQRPWISLLPDWQVRLGLNGIRVTCKTKILLSLFAKIHLSLPGKLLANPFAPKPYYRKFLLFEKNRWSIQRLEKLRVSSWNFIYCSFCAYVLTFKKLSNCHIGTKCKEKS